MFQVAYRTGGFKNAKWHLTVAMESEERAAQVADEIKRMGYFAIARPKKVWDSVGIPVGYCERCCPMTGACLNRGICTFN